MGSRVMRRLPKFVHGFIDRHGRPRFDLRRPGFEFLKPLRGLPYSATFMNDYEAAMAGQPLPRRRCQDAAGQHDGAGAELLRFTRFPHAGTSQRNAPIAGSSNVSVRIMATSERQTCGVIISSS